MQIVAHVAARMHFLSVRTTCQQIVYEQIDKPKEAESPACAATRFGVCAVYVCILMCRVCDIDCHQVS